MGRARPHALANRDLQVLHRPQPHAKVEDLCGLCLAPPAGAVVLCIDEKPQIQALDRTAPTLPLRPGLAERRPHDDVRHGVTELFAALETATGKVGGRCFARHRHDEFLVFLTQVARAWPQRELQVVVDNASTHRHAEVTAWLATIPGSPCTSRPPRRAG